MVTESHRGTVLLVDTNQALRTSLAEKLRGRSFEIIGEADSGPDGLRQALQTAPDVLVLDGSGPQTDIAGVTAKIARMGLATQVLLVGPFDDLQSVLESFQSGVRACVSRARALSDVPAAIGQLLRGYCYLSPEISNRVTGLAGPPPAFSTFTSLEMDIALRVVRDIPKNEIAKQLDLSKAKVNESYKTLMEKLEANHIGSLLRHAIRHNFLDLQVQRKG